MTRKIQVVIHVKYTVIFSCPGLGFGLNQGWVLLIYSKQIRVYNNFCESLCLKENIPILKHTRYMGTYYLSYFTLFLSMEEKEQLDFHGNERNNLPFFNKDLAEIKVFCSKILESPICDKHTLISPS